MLFTGGRTDMRIAREEIFGPVLTAIHSPTSAPMRRASPTTSTTALPVTCGPATSGVPTGSVTRSKPE